MESQVEFAGMLSDDEDQNPGNEISSKDRSKGKSLFCIQAKHFLFIPLHLDVQSRAAANFFMSEFIKNSTVSTILK
jgi:hypothetical protein